VTVVAVDEGVNAPVARAEPLNDRENVLTNDGSPRRRLSRVKDRVQLDDVERQPGRGEQHDHGDQHAQ